ncbi:ATP-binding protein [Runella sp. MFBS21]|uniref:ATP-binding protein n=1 Tax=Runella sp. MFBS21 TaxID=3034018 RepID=UPI0023F86A9C|nr:ATP-binding protein [Runella sp. MFBS21]MDF7816979.1 ATP-binding protein [Runella sp. MFBS21]
MKHFVRYLEAIITVRLDVELGGKTEEEFPAFIIEPTDDEKLSSFIVKHQLCFEEITILLLALMPHLYPTFFDKILHQYFPNGADFPEFGGVRGLHHRGILPTGETALFILASGDLEKRLVLYELFSETHLFAQKHILRLEEVVKGEPRFGGRLVLSDEYVELFTMGRVSLPQYGSQFPAQLIETDLEWDDLILPCDTRRQIQDLENWINHHSSLQAWEWGKYLKPGYRALFYGPSGTGKTLTATLLGKFTKREVFRVDLSLVVSKYIGETEKNLALLFDKAHAKNWILFFDEADALFGKRTETRDAHDRYANQEVAYLLQKIEDFDGLVILASNLKNNIDSAFARRFQTIVHFPMPTAKERWMLWQKYWPPTSPLPQGTNLKDLADRYELSGAAILNVIHLGLLRALASQRNEILLSDLLEIIKLEYFKEGKLIV